MKKYTYLLIVGIFFGIVQASELKKDPVVLIIKSGNQNVGLTREIVDLSSFLKKQFVTKKSPLPIINLKKEDVPESLLPLVIDMLKKLNEANKAGKSKGKIPDLTKILSDAGVEKKDVVPLIQAFNYLQVKPLVALLMFKYGKEYKYRKSNTQRILAKHMKVAGLPKAIQEDIDNLTFSIRELIALGQVPREIKSNKLTSEYRVLGLEYLLDLKYKKIDNLDGLREIKGFDSLQILDLAYNKLTNLKSGIFQGFRKLITLKLSFNKITRLPEKVFEGLDSLEELALGYNPLTALPEKVLYGAKNLKALFLGSTQITSLPEKMFQGLNKIERLSFNNNKITDLSPRVFQGLDKLCYLSFTDNRLTILPEKVFEGLHSLKDIYLGRNQLKKLPEKVFKGLRSLEHLYLGGNAGMLLGGNQLTSLPEKVFEGLESLRVLHLERNQLARLPEKVFWGLKNLIILYLNNNKLTSLPERVFQGLDSLRELHLEKNPLTNLTEKVFQGLNIHQGDSSVDYKGKHYASIKLLQEFLIREAEAKEAEALQVKDSLRKKILRAKKRQ